MERWQKRGLIRAIPLSGGARRVRAEDLATLHSRGFTGFAPLREDGDVVRVKSARSIG
jgi:hypothetical protein